MVAAVVFGADAVAELVVDLFSDAQAGAVFAAGIAHPAAQPTALAQRYADIQVHRVVLLLVAAHLPLGAGRQRHRTDARAPGGQRPAAAVAGKIGRARNPGAERTQTWMGPAQVEALLVAVARIPVVVVARVSAFFKLAIADAAPGIGGADRPLLTQALGPRQIGLYPGDFVLRLAVGHLRGQLDLAVQPRQPAQAGAHRAVFTGRQHARAEGQLRVQGAGPAATDYPRILAFGIAHITHSARCHGVTRGWQPKPEHGRWHGEASFTADALLDRDFNVRARVQATHIGEGKGPGGHHGGMNQRAVLANLDLGRAVGDALDQRALALFLKGVLGEHLHAGNLRAGQHRVVQVDLPGLQHRLVAGEGALGIGLQMGAA